MMLIGGHPTAGKATITYDNDWSDIATSTDTLTIAVDPANGNSNRMAIVTVGWEKGGNQETCDTVTYNGNACTEVAEKNYNNGSVYDGISQWYCDDADIDTEGSANVVITMSGNIGGMSGGVMMLYNVKQQAPEDSCSANSTGTTATCSITTLTANAWITDSVMNEGAAVTNTPAAGQTEQFTQSDLQTTDGGTLAKETAGQIDMDWTVSSSGMWGIVSSAWEAADL